MKKTSLFEKTVVYQNKITILDLLSGVFQKHNSEDLENALLAGTANDRAASESAMLQKWRAPWIFAIVLAAGVIASVVSYLLALLTGHTVFIMLSLTVPAFVSPITLMFFFWEMNAPKNISFFQLMLCFFLGGVLSIFATLILEIRGLSRFSAVFAPLTEEPAKLMISLLVMYLFSRKKGFKIYGMTGLTVGAAVGAGFAALESAYYIFSFSVGGMLVLFSENINAFMEHITEVLQNGGQLMNISNTFFQELYPLISEVYIETTVIRFLGGFCSHVLYCTIYVTAGALLMKDHTFETDVLFDKRFWGLFLFSIVMHGFNNIGVLNVYLTFLIELVLEWGVVVFLVRKCFSQIAAEVSTVNPGSVLATDLKLSCVSGAHQGKQFAMKHESILIGTGAICDLVYPMGTKGVSERQCKLVVKEGVLYLADTGSLEGTYLNGVRLKPLMGQQLKRGDCFWLGTEEEKFLVV